MPIGLKGFIALQNKTARLQKEIDALEPIEVECETLCLNLSNANVEVDNAQNILELASNSLEDAQNNLASTESQNADCIAECPALEGPSFYIDDEGTQANTNTNFEVAPYSTSPLENGGWVLFTYAEGAPEEQNILDVFQTEGFMNFEGENNYIIYNSEAAVYWPMFGLNAIGNLVPGESYQINIQSASYINSSAVDGLEGTFSTDSDTCVEECNAEFNIPEAAEAVENAQNEFDSAEAALNNAFEVQNTAQSAVEEAGCVC